MNPNKSLSLSIMSGKGGVGKSNLALNLCFALFDQGLTSLLMDCDLGLANLDVLLGVTPDKNLQDLLRDIEDPRDVVVQIEKGGFDFLPAASGVPELVEMDEDMQDVLFKKIMQLLEGYEMLVLDLGAGINSTALAFASMTQLRMIVVTPEPTSLTDSYAMMKVLSTEHGVNDFLVVVNMATNKAEAMTPFDRLDGACRNFLGIEPRFLGYITLDPKVPDAVRHQTPLLRHAPSCKASLDIINLAKVFLRYRKDNLEAISKRPVLKNFPSL
ncbi:MAG: MinD/ParA family protein [Proteobacteria bacterium]|nr:MinD/ParA family protein [Pseudomonadota bacterium]